MINEFKTSPPYEVNIEVIDDNSINSDEWLNISKDELNTINKKIRDSREIHYFRGYRKIWKDIETTYSEYKEDFAKLLLHDNWKIRCQVAHHMLEVM